MRRIDLAALLRVGRDLADNGCVRRGIWLLGIVVIAAVAAFVRVWKRLGEP
jgi:hypothetical protein